MFHHIDIRAVDSEKKTEIKMVQTHMEERLEAYDQELLGMKKELSKLPTMEEKLTTITSRMET